jgi:hypothetical protein
MISIIINAKKKAFSYPTFVKSLTLLKFVVFLLSFDYLKGENFLP